MSGGGTSNITLVKIHEKNNVASTGSLTRSTLLISTKGSENGPDLPKTLLYFCNIKVNETTILITGGLGAGRSKSTFQNMVTGQRGATKKRQLRL